MKRKRLTKFGVFTVYAVALITFLSSVFLLQRTLFKESAKEPLEEQQKYVNDSLFDVSTPVIGETEQSNEIAIIKPYIDENVQIVKNFYDFKADEKEQQNALLYYEGTYMPNSGVIYGGNFDVVAILDGTVTSITEDEMLGTIIEIKHSNDIISIYQSVAEVSIKVNDTVKQGQVIAKTGKNNISKDLNEHLHFELVVKGETVNPENYYNRNINDL